LNIGSPTRARTWDLRINSPSPEKPITPIKSHTYELVAGYISNVIQAD